MSVRQPNIPEQFGVPNTTSICREKHPSETGIKLEGMCGGGRGGGGGKNEYQDQLPTPVYSNSIS